MNAKTLILKDIVEKFNLTLVAGNSESLNREITIGGINRAGLELANFIPKNASKKKRIILLGGKESEYVNTLSVKEREERYKNIILQNIPAIFIGIHFNDPVLIEYAKKLNFPVIEANYTTNDFYSIVVSYIDSCLASSQTIHASLVNIYGLGALIKGDSGIGKSENALELVKKGHMFVGDDAILLKRYANKIIAKGDEKLKQHLEIRGIGFLDLTKVYGWSAIMSETNIDVIINLKLANDEYFQNINRVKTSIDYEEILGLKIPSITIPVTSGRNIAELIEAAVITIKLHNEGINSSEDFINNIDESLKK